VVASSGAMSALLVNSERIEENIWETVHLGPCLLAVSVAAAAAAICALEPRVHPVGGC